MRKRIVLTSRPSSKTFKRFSALFISILFMTSVSLCSTGCADRYSATDTRIFTDSCKRQVTVPTNIERVAVSGPLAQIMCYALCPDKMIELSSEWDESLEGLMEEQYYTLPVLGKVYNQANLNVEELITLNPQVLIDVGEEKSNVADDMNTLSSLTGIPCVHINADLQTMPEAFIMLGNLLNLPTEANILAGYCTEKYDLCKGIVEKAGAKKLLYLTGDEGLNVIVKGSYHAEVIDLISDNVATIDNPTSKGTGNEVNIEQIINWDPDYIIFSANSIAGSVENDPVWSTLSAIKNNHYYEVPWNPYNWIGAPSSLQRHLNLLWYTKTLYPEYATYNLYDEVHEYLNLFYHIDLSKETYDDWTNK